MLMSLLVLEVLFYLFILSVINLVIVFRKDIWKLIKKLWRKMKWMRKEH